MIKGIGTDIIEINRIKQAMERRERFLTRVFTPMEVDYCLAQGNPAASLAARFAAKEAVFKALGPVQSGGSWQEIEIVVDEKGRPVVRLQGKLAKQACGDGVSGVMISLSHEREYAIAFAIVY